MEKFCSLLITLKEIQIFLGLPCNWRKKVKIVLRVKFRIWSEDFLEYPLIKQTYDFSNELYKTNDVDLINIEFSFEKCDDMNSTQKIVLIQNGLLETWNFRLYSDVMLQILPLNRFNVLEYNIG